jgi:hypothetical protein
MAHHIEIVFTGGDDSPVDLGKLDRPSSEIGLDEHVGERIGDAGAASNGHRLRVATLDGCTVLLRVATRVREASE